MQLKTCPGHDKLTINPIRRVATKIRQLIRNIQYSAVFQQWYFRNAAPQ